MDIDDFLDFLIVFVMGWAEETEPKIKLSRSNMSKIIKDQRENKIIPLKYEICPKHIVPSANTIGNRINKLLIKKYIVEGEKFYTGGKPATEICLSEKGKELYNKIKNLIPMIGLIPHFEYECQECNNCTENDRTECTKIQENYIRMVLNDYYKVKDKQYYRKLIKQHPDFCEKEELLYWLTVHYASKKKLEEKYPHIKLE
jgi:hypothetical protein